jgi:xylulokinase
MAKLLGIDIGTSGCKLLVIDELGKVLAEAASEYPLSTPHPMWSEQDPEDWWTGVKTSLSKLGDIKYDAIGLTGQMHGSVFLDASDEVIRPAILWNDQRTVKECREIEERIGLERLLQITCNPPLTGFQAPKVLWLRNHEPASFERIRHVLLPKDYIRYRLTGQMATDVSDASGTGLLDVPHRNWSAPIFDDLGLDRRWFPEVLESSTVAGFTKDGTPVVAGGGDQAAAATGTGSVAPGTISVSLGTSGVVFTATGPPDHDPTGAAHTFCHTNGRWHSMGVMLSCGAALKWHRDTLCGSAGYDQLANEAASVPDTDGITFLPYLAGERCPYNDPYATSVFGGLRVSHTRGHLTRAVFEGITFGLKDCLELLLRLGARANEVRVTGGGARSSFWLQLIADTFGLPCSTLETDQGPAFGAALLAGVGVGIWPNLLAACDATVRTKSVVEPNEPQTESLHQRYRELYCSTRDWNRSETKH